MLSKRLYFWLRQKVMSQRSFRDLSGESKCQNVKRRIDDKEEVRSCFVFDFGLERIASRDAVMLCVVKSSE